MRNVPAPFLSGPLVCSLGQVSVRHRQDGHLQHFSPAVSGYSGDFPLSNRRSPVLGELAFSTAMRVFKEFNVQSSVLVLTERFGGYLNCILMSERTAVINAFLFKLGRFLS